MVDAIRSPIGRPPDRTYVDVGTVTVSDGESSFLLPRFEGGQDFLHRDHELFYELVALEDPDQPLVAGTRVTVSLGGSDEYPEGELPEVVRLPRESTPQASSLGDLELVRGTATAIEWTPIGGGEPPDDEPTHSGVVMLVSTDGVVVEYCSEGYATGATITAEALEAYLAHEPSGEGRLVRTTERYALVHSGVDRYRLVWVIAHWAAVQKFRIVDP